MKELFQQSLVPNKWMKHLAHNTLAASFSPLSLVSKGIICTSRGEGGAWVHLKSARPKWGLFMFKFCFNKLVLLLKLPVHTVATRYLDELVYLLCLTKHIQTLRQFVNVLCWRHSEYLKKRTKNVHHLDNIALGPFLPPPGWPIVANAPPSGTRKSFELPD